MRKLYLYSQLLSASLAVAVLPWETVAKDVEESVQHIKPWAEEDFARVDVDGDGIATWGEVKRQHDDMLSGLTFSQQTVLDQFDHNKDGALQKSEYLVFISHLAEEALEQRAAELDPSEKRKANDSRPTVANELADEAIDGAMVPGGTDIPGVDVPPIDLTGVPFATTSGGFEHLDRETLAGKEIVNLKNEVVGEIDAIVASDEGEVKGLVVESGGFFGLAATDIFVPLETVYLVGEVLVWETLLDAEMIASRQSYHYDESFGRLIEH